MPQNYYPTALNGKKWVAFFENTHFNTNILYISGPIQVNILPSLKDQTQKEIGTLAKYISLPMSAATRPTDTHSSLFLSN